MSDAHIRAVESKFTLPPALVGIVWEYLSAIRIAPPSEKLDAFTRAVQLIAGLIGPEFPSPEAGERLWAAAQACGLVGAYGEDVVQAKLSEGFENPIFPDETDGGTEDRARPPEFTDESLALCFAELHAGDLRYVAAWRRWLSWNGTRWQFDDTLFAYNLARKVCRAASAQCNKPKDASVLASAKTVAAVERLARADMLAQTAIHNEPLHSSGFRLGEFLSMPSHRFGAALSCIAASIARETAEKNGKRFLKTLTQARGALRLRALGPALQGRVVFLPSPIPEWRAQDFVVR